MEFILNSPRFFHIVIVNTICERVKREINILQEQIDFVIAGTFVNVDVFLNLAFEYIYRKTNSFRLICIRIHNFINFISFFSNIWAQAILVSRFLALWDFHSFLFEILDGALLKGDFIKSRDAIGSISDTDGEFKKLLQLGNIEFVVGQNVELLEYLFTLTRHLLNMKTR